MDGWNQPSAPQLVKNIVLVGRTGNGKSATGNSLIGKNVFISEATASSGITTCKAYETKTPDGMVINVIETPGLFDLSESTAEISKEIIKCLTLAEEGLHVVVLVLSVRNRITKEEENTLSALQVLFGDEILDHLIVLFTGGDELEAKQKTLDDYFRQGCPEFLKTVLRMCDGRTVVFNNRSTDKRKKVAQVQQFLAHVATIDKRNNGQPYRAKMHPEIKKEAEKLRQLQSAFKARNLGEAEFAKMKKELEKSYETRMSQMEKTVENMLRENLNKAEQDNISLRNKQSQDQKNQTILQLGLAAPGLLGMVGMCSIL